MEEEVLSWSLDPAVASGTWLKPRVSIPLVSGLLSCGRRSADWINVFLLIFQLLLRLLG